MGLLLSVTLRTGFGVILFMGMITIIDGFAIAGGQDVTTVSGGSVAWTRLNTLINTMTENVDASVPDSSNPLDFGWSIATGVWNAIRLLFEIAPIIILIITEAVTGSAIFVDAWVYAIINMVVNSLIFVLIIMLVHQRNG